MAVAPNADIYASGRIGIFFPANAQTPADGDLTGQCVTLVKWFMAEMCSVPNPFAARGDARYVGDNLVAQGLATVVPAGQQREGDVVVYKYGQYGHIGILLSGGRFFQENANTAGAQRRVLADGTVVYSSTIVPLYSSLGGAAPSFYRLKSYVGNVAGGDEGVIGNTDNEYARWRQLGVQVRGRVMGRDEFVAAAVGRTWLAAIEILSDDAEAVRTQQAQEVGQIAVNDNWQQQIYDRMAERDAAYKNIADLQKQIVDLGSRPTQKQLDDLTASVAAAKKEAEDAEAALKQAQDQQAADTATGNSFLRWLGGILGKLK